MALGAAVCPYLSTHLLFQFTKLLDLKKTIKPINNTFHFFKESWVFNVYFLSYIFFT